MPYFLEEYNNIKRNKPKTREEMKNFILGRSLSQFWGRCEYELLLSDWPNASITTKIDGHYQIDMNVEAILDILEYNLYLDYKEKKSSKKVKKSEI
jgi:hypothetical protein